MDSRENQVTQGIDVSVVIPSYNHALFIVDAIESVIQQTFRSWELIIVDDGSTDGSCKLLESKFGLHNQIKIIFQNNQGAHHAINRGMALASGRYISILNSDDIYHPERLQKLVNYCDQNPVDLAFTLVSPIDANGLIINAEGHPWCRLYARLIRELQEDGVKMALLTGNFAITTSNFFFHSRLFLELGGFANMRYNHDWDFMARLVHKGMTLKCVGDGPLLSYRIHGGNTITQNTLKARLELKRILRSLIPPADPYCARLVSRIELNMRSIRREHEVRLLTQQLAQIENSRLHKLERLLARLISAFRRLFV
jgi:O-antigen biosynthesis protein